MHLLVAQSDESREALQLRQGEQGSTVPFNGVGSAADDAALKLPLNLLDMLYSDNTECIAHFVRGLLSKSTVFVVLTFLSGYFPAMDLFHLVSGSSVISQTCDSLEVEKILIERVDLKTEGGLYFRAYLGTCEERRRRCQD